MKLLQIILFISIPLLFVSNPAYSENKKNTAKSEKASTKESGSKLKRVNKLQKSNSKPGEPLRVILAEEDKDKWNWNLIIPILAILAGIISVLFQQYKLHRSRLQVQDESIRKKLKLEVYENISDIVDRANSAVSHAGIDIFSTATMLQSYTNNTTLKYYYNLHDFTDKFRDAMFLVGDVLIILEKYRIALPKFIIFRLAIKLQSDILLDEITSISQFITNSVMVDPKKDNEPYLSFHGNELVHFRDEAKKFMEETTEMNSYLSDLLVDAQNELLSGLFTHHVPVREPADPNYRAISVSKNTEEQINYLRSRAPKKDKFEKLLEEFEKN